MQIQLYGVQKVYKEPLPIIVFCSHTREIMLADQSLVLTLPTWLSAHVLR